LPSNFSDHRQQRLRDDRKRSLLASFDLDEFQSEADVARRLTSVAGVLYFSGLHAY
jgi:hypothetical protein